MSALGELLAGEPHGPFRNLILSHLFGLASIKDVDLHLTVGAALAQVSNFHANSLLPFPYACLLVYDPYIPNFPSLHPYLRHVLASMCAFI